MKDDISKKLSESFNMEGANEIVEYVFFSLYFTNQLL